MEASAKLSSIRITPRKMGLVADQVRGKNVNEALVYLQHQTRKRTAQMIHKLIKSAVANLDQKGPVDIYKLYLKELLVGKGTTLKRFRPRAKGSAFPIKKRNCHVSVTVCERGK